VSRPTPPPLPPRHGPRVAPKHVAARLRAHRGPSASRQMALAQADTTPGQQARPVETPAPRKPRNARRTILRGVLGTLVVIFGVVGFYAYRILEPASHVTGQKVGQSKAEHDLISQLYKARGASIGASSGQNLTNNGFISLPELKRDQRINILLLASDNDRKWIDQHAKYPATQVMLVLTLDPLHNTVGLLSIPRDLLVTVPGYGDHKIDEAHLLGGVGLARQTVESALGIPISAYAWLGLDGFVKVIDAAGGVDVDSPFPILDDEYPNDLAAPNDPYSTRRLYIPAGPQHFDGVRGLEYVRSRHGTQIQDFARNVHQQQVLSDLKRKLVGPQILTKLLDLSGLLKKSLISTDLDENTLLALALYARDHRPRIAQRLVLSPPLYSQNATRTVNGVEQDYVQPTWAAIRPAITGMFQPLAPVTGTVTAGPLTVKKRVAVPSNVAKHYQSSHDKLAAVGALVGSPTVPPTPRAQLVTQVATPRSLATPPVPAAPTAVYTLRQDVTAATAPFSGTLAFARSGDIYAVDRNGVRLLIHRSNAQNARDPALSPDGTSLVYIHQFQNHADIWLANRAGSNPHSLTHDNVDTTNIKNNYWAAQPSWSPDGQHLLFISDRAKYLGPTPNDVGQYGMSLYRLDVGTGNGGTLLDRAELWTGGDADPTWRPSVAGSYAYTKYHYDPTVPSVTGQVRLSDGTLLVGAKDGVFQPSWSPDGRMLAYVERQGEVDLLRVIVFSAPTSSVASRPVTVASGMLAHPVWSPDGARLGFVSLLNGHFAVRTVALSLQGQTVSMGTLETVAGTDDVDAASTLSWAR